MCSCQYRHLIRQSLLPSFEIIDIKNVCVLEKNFKVFEKNIKIIDTLEKIKNSDDVWICGGEAIYSQTLKNCKFLFLTTVKKNYNGDKHFPNFKDDFILEEKIFENEELCIEKYKNKKAETE